MNIYIDCTYKCEKLCYYLKYHCTLLRVHRLYIIEERINSKHCGFKVKKM